MSQYRGHHAASTNPLVSVENLSVGFEDGRDLTWAVSGLNLTIGANETLALLGESGCGKSLTASALMQLLPSGAVVSAQSRVRYDNRDCLSLSENEMRELRGGDFAMVFQEPMTALNPVMTIAQQIHEVLQVRGMAAKQAKTTRTRELLTAVGIPEPDQIGLAYPHQLSGGMKQRVVIAMALAGEPKCLIADEPTTALDATIQAQILTLLAQLKEQFSMSILFITHDLGVVRRFADRIAVMYAGHIVESAPIETFFAAPKHPYSQQLLCSLPSLEKRDGELAVIPGSVPKLAEIESACRFASRCSWSWQRCHEQKPRNITVGKGADVRCHLHDECVADKPREPHEVESQSAMITAPDERTVTTPVTLQVSDLKIYYPIHQGVLKRHVGDVKAVDGVSLTLQSGKTTAIVGESGCGKTTLGKSLVQLLAPTSGDISYDGKSICHGSQHQRRLMRQQIQMIFQDPFSSMNPRMRVGDIIMEGMKLCRPSLTKQARESECEALLQQVDLPLDAMMRYPHQFSGGQRQRIAIARALGVQPRVIVCDEPTSALDVSVQAKLLNLLRRLQRERQLAYCFITHDIAVLGFMADEVCVMYLGRIVERGSVEEVLQQAKHPYTQALLAAVPKVEGNGANGGQSRQATAVIGGDIPSPANPPAGCHFHPRCPSAMPQCKLAYPSVTQVSKTQSVHCYLYE